MAAVLTAISELPYGTARLFALRFPTFARRASSVWLAQTVSSH